MSIKLNHNSLWTIIIICWNE